ncbi:MAG: 16S rRNA (cytosine(1402)-N(4))-methyltransferase RsmH [bacterium]
MHYSVLLAETIEWMNILSGRPYADLTCGMGGHTRAIAERAAPGRVYAMDRDASALEMARRNLADGPQNIEFIHTAFSRARQALTERGVGKVAGLTADLGLSRVQLPGDRGFSCTTDGPLDMRQDPSRGVTAAELVNQLPERELANLLFNLAQERRSYVIARALVRNRPVHTSLQLAEIVSRAVPRTGSKLHPATLTFMALRMAVNEELEEVTALMEALPDLLEPGGRAVIIAFHSGEARIVKTHFQRLHREGRARLLTKHAVKPTDREVHENSASRSATLRVLEML